MMKIVVFALFVAGGKDKVHTTIVLNSSHTHFSKSELYGLVHSPKGYCLSLSVYGCGKPTFPPSVSRVVGGEDVEPHSWPWQVKC